MDQFENQIEDDEELPPILEDTDDEELPPIVEELSLGSEVPQYVNDQQQQIIIFLDAKDFEKKEHLAIVTYSQITIKDLQNQCEKKFQKIHFSNCWYLAQNNEKLDSNQTLKQLKIQNNSILQIKKERQVPQLGDLSIDNIIDGITELGGKRINIILSYPKIGKERQIEICENVEFSYQKDIHWYHKDQLIRPRSPIHLKNGDCVFLHKLEYGGCFPFYAPITMCDKSTKVICDIEKGDKILCYDYESKQFKASTVLGKRKTEEFFPLIRIETENGIIECTADHPFYTQSGWKAVEPNPDFYIEKLNIVDKLLNEENIFVQIVSINYLDQKEQVYNLIMEYPNNYVVFGFLAHNMNKISIKIDGQIEELEFFPDMPIQLIKALIYKKKGIKIENQQLFFNGILMKDENTVRDYNCYPIQNDDKMCPTIEVTKYPKLDLEIDDNPIQIQQQQQQQQSLKNDNQNIIPIKIISKKSSYQILIKKESTVQDLKNVVYTLEDQSKQGILLINGQYLENLMDDIQIKNLRIQAIYSIPKSEGVCLIKFMNDINSLELMQLSDLKQSLRFLKCNIDKLFDALLAKINRNEEKKQIFQKYQLHHLIAIILWTSTIIHQKLNRNLRNKSYEDWKVYIKCLVDGLKYSEYHKGIFFRGIVDYQNTEIYQKGKIIQWREISAFSKNRKVAENFSNNKGMIFIAGLVSAKDISQLSLSPKEEELLMPPFTSFKVLDVVITENSPIVVKMKEFPLAKTANIILWVDDRPENNYQLAQSFETKNPKLSIIFSRSTKEAINLVKMYKWLIYLNNSQFRIVTDMVRKEKGELNYLAGLQFLQYLNTQLSYKKEILYFVNDENYANQILQQSNLKNYKVTKSVSVLERFVNFQ